MRRLFVTALSLTILLPLLAVLLTFAAASSQAQCGGAVGPASAPGVPSNLLAIYEQAAGSYQLGTIGMGLPGGDQRDRDQLRPRPLPLHRRRDRLDAVRARHLGPIPGLGRPGQTRRAAGPRRPVGRDLHRRPLPARQRRPRRLADRAVRLQPRRLVRRPSRATRPTLRTDRRHRRLGGRRRRRAGCVTAGPSTPGPAARIVPDGLAAVPQDAPAQVQAAIAAGNRIIDTSYSTERQPNMLSTVMGSYDCSGSTDFVLYNADLTQPPGRRRQPDRRQLHPARNLRQPRPVTDTRADALRDGAGTRRPAPPPTPDPTPAHAGRGTTRTTPDPARTPRPCSASARSRSTNQGTRRSPRPHARPARQPSTTPHRSTASAPDAPQSRAASLHHTERHP